MPRASRSGRRHEQHDRRHDRAARDVISANGGNGVRITGAGTTGNVVEGDYIGTNASGEYGLVGNGGYGVSIDSGASNNTIGGTIIRGSRRDLRQRRLRRHLLGSGTTGNVVEGSYIGIDATGEYRVGQRHRRDRHGGGASSNVIGGTTSSWLAT